MSEIHVQGVHLTLENQVPVWLHPRLASRCDRDTDLRHLQPFDSHAILSPAPFLLTAQKVCLCEVWQPLTIISAFALVGLGAGQPLISLRHLRGRDRIIAWKTSAEKFRQLLATVRECRFRGPAGSAPAALRLPVESPVAVEHPTVG